MLADVDRRILIAAGVGVIALILAVSYFFFGGGAVRTYAVQILVDGKPASGVSVTVQFPDGSVETFITDESGFIRFEGPPGAKIVDVSEGFEAPLPVDADIGTINLEAPKKRVVVVVKDEEGNPLTADVKILVNGELAHEESGDTITYDVTGLEDDKILIKASAEGFQTAQKVYTFKTLPGRVILTLRKPESEQKRYGAIVALVRDESGIGIDGKLKVYVKGSAVAVTETEIVGGYAAVEGLQYGTYTLKVFRENALLAEEDVVVNKETTEVEITVSSESVQRAIIHVLDKTNNQPISGATVEITVEGKTWTEKTDEDGVLELGLQGDACADLYITAHGYKATSATICAGDETNVLLDKLPTSGTLVVHVYNQLGQPIPNARVYLVFGDHAVGDTYTTGEQGAVRITGIEPGTYIVKAEVGSYTGASDPIEVRAGRTSSADVYVFPGEANAVLHVSIDGSPASVTVEAYVRGKKMRTGETGIDGSVSLAVPADVEVRFHIYGPFTFVSRPYRFVPNETREINIDIPSDFSGVRILGVYQGGVPVEGVAPGTTYSLRFMYKTENEGKVVVAITDGYWGVSLLGTGWTFKGWNNPPGNDPIGEALQSTAEGKQIAIKDAISGAIVEDEIHFQTSSTLVGDYITIYVGAGGNQDSKTIIIGDSMLCGDTVCYSAVLVQNGEPIDEPKAEYPTEVRVTLIPRAEMPGLRAEVVYTDAEGTSTTICSLDIQDVTEKSCPFVPKEGAVQISLRVKQCGSVCEDVEEIPLVTTEALAEHREMGMIVDPTTLVAVRKEQHINVITYDVERTMEEGLTPVDATIYVYAYVSTSYQSYKMLVFTVNTANGRAKVKITPAENWDHIELVARAKDYDDAVAVVSLQDHAIEVSPMELQIDLTAEESAQLTITNLMDTEVSVDIIPRNTSRCLSVEAEPSALTLEAGEESTVNIIVSGGETCIGQVDILIGISASIGPSKVEYVEPLLSIYPKGNCLEIEAPERFSFAPGEGAEVIVRNVCEAPLEVLVESDVPAIAMTPAEFRIPAYGEQRVLVTYQPEGGEARAEGEVTITATYQQEDRQQSVHVLVPYTYFDESACVTLEETVQGHYEDGKLVADITPEISEGCGVLKNVSIKGGKCSVNVGNENLHIVCDPKVSLVEYGYVISLEIVFTFEHAVDTEKIKIEAPPVSGDPIAIQAYPYRESVAEVTISNNFPVDLEVDLSFTAPFTVYYTDSFEPGSVFERVSSKKITIKAHKEKTFYIAVEQPCTVLIKAQALGRTYTTSVKLTAGALVLKVTPPLIGKDAYTVDIPVGISVEQYASLCKNSWCTEDVYAEIRNALKDNLDALDPLTRYLASWYFVVVTDTFEGHDPGYYLVTWTDGGEQWNEQCTKEACQTLAKSAKTLARSEAMNAEDCGTLAGQLETIIEDSGTLAKNTLPIVFAIEENPNGGATYPSCTNEVYIFQVKDNAYLAVREGTTLFGENGTVIGPAYISTGKYWAVRKPTVTCPKTDIEMTKHTISFDQLKQLVTFDNLKKNGNIVYVELKNTAPTVVKCTCSNGDSFRYTPDTICHDGKTFECNANTLGTIKREWLCVEKEGTYAWLECGKDVPPDNNWISASGTYICTYNTAEGYFWKRYESGEGGLQPGEPRVFVSVTPNECSIEGMVSLTNVDFYEITGYCDSRQKFNKQWSGSESNMELSLSYSCSPGTQEYKVVAVGCLNDQCNTSHVSGSLNCGGGGKEGQSEEVTFENVLNAYETDYGTYYYNIGPGTTCELEGSSIKCNGELLSNYQHGQCLKDVWDYEEGIHLYYELVNEDTEVNIYVCQNGKWVKEVTFGNYLEEYSGGYDLQTQSIQCEIRNENELWCSGQYMGEYSAGMCLSYDEEIDLYKLWESGHRLCGYVCEKGKWVKESAEGGSFPNIPDIHP